MQFSYRNPDHHRRRKIRIASVAVAATVSALCLTLAVSCSSNGDTAETTPANQAPKTAEAVISPSPTDSPVQPAPTTPPTPTATPPPPTPTPIPAEILRTGDEPLAPELRNTGAWINSEPFTLESRRGEVVLLDFWTYTCINCQRTLPYMKSWHEKYNDAGLVVLGVHTPEFEFEELLENVQNAVDEFDLLYPIVQDNDYGTWRAFSNRYWPAKYLIDKDGYIRYTHFGEGRYEQTEQWIRALLEEAGADLSEISNETAPVTTLDIEFHDGNSDEMQSLDSIVSAYDTGP